MLAKSSLRSSCRAARLSAVAFAGLAAAFLMLADAPLHAASYSWATSTGDWSIVSNWGGTIPAGSDTAYVVNGGTVNVTQLGETCGTLSLGGGAQSGAAQMSSGSLSIQIVLSIGNSGLASFTQSGGTTNISYQWQPTSFPFYGPIYLGSGAGSYGTYNLGGSATLLAGQEYAGYDGTGSITQNNALNQTTGLFLGYNPGATGSYNLNGPGTLNITYQSGMSGNFGVGYLGYSGSGTFIQSAGSVSAYYGIDVGFNPGASGSYSLSGNGQLSAWGGLVVGYRGLGTFTQTGGTNTSPLFYLGYSPSGSGSYTLGSGLLSVPYYQGQSVAYIGYSGSGTFTQTGGTNTVAGPLNVGYNGSGTYSLGGSGVLSSGTLDLGAGTGGGTLVMGGATLLSATTEYVGNGLLQQTSGTNATVRVYIGAGGRYAFAGGLLQINGVGFSSLGVFDGGGGSGTISTSNCTVDLSQGALQNVGHMSLSMGTNSLLIVPPGFNVSTTFGHYSSSGLTYITGSTLTVPAGRGFSGSCTINDPVVCQGAIVASSGGYVTLNNGLILSAGTVQLANGSLVNNDATSGISGGSLSWRISTSAAAAPVRLRRQAEPILPMLSTAPPSPRVIWVSAYRQRNI